jgi:phosphopantothenoylcysteine decarboxylase/phosphopantothenate--cysteine ligase
MVLQNKNILLGITGGIAAYKCAHLVRLLIKKGARVKVVMTKSAAEFVTPQTLSVLSKDTVTTDFFDSNHNWNNHVHLAEWADVIIIAPLTANTLGKFSNGICDNIVTACYLSARSAVYVAPAMDLDMYQHPTTKENLIKIEKNGTIIIPAETGELASGLSGEGRMAEPENIVTFLENHLSKNLPLAGKKVLVNAGPTYEAIDPVRFIGNRSSGKTGVAIAERFAALGAQVSLVLGPSSLKPHHSVNVIPVESAEEMFKVCADIFDSVDIAVLSAAVADYKPKQAETSKIKKKDEALNLDLVKTKDILSHLGSVKKKQCLVGFALETENTTDNAKQKLTAKNADIIIANTTSSENPAFGSDFNSITIVDKHNKLANFEFRSKDDLAKEIVNHIINFAGIK